MRAAVLRGQWDLAVETLRDPEPGPGEVLVRVAACGVCHSDLHLIKGETPARLPMVLGHEIAGTVVALGDGVEGPAVGAGVVAPFILPCGDCAECARGRDEFCARFWALNRGQGTLFDGTTRLHRPDGEPVWMNAMSGLAELAVVPATSVFPAPPRLALADAAPIGCAVFTAFGAARHGAQLQAGERVAVVAVGGVGMSLVQVARAMGASEVIAIDVVADKLDAARAQGATHAIDGAREDVAARVAEITDGAGVDVAFEALGRPETLRQALGVLGRGGRCVAIGVGAAGTLTEIEVNALVRSELRLIGSYGARTRADMPELLALVESGAIRPEASISRRVGLDEVGEAFRAMDRGEIVGRAIVEFN
jgi:succinate semialdehyde reductase (NADPH)